MSPSSGTFSNPDQRLYVSDSAAGRVIPIAIDIRQAGRPISVGQNPRTCMLTPGGDILLVVDAASNDLAVIRAKTSALITLIPVGGRPRDVVVKVF
jgi:YVTN family beta-propeller protein